VAEPIRVGRYLSRRHQEMGKKVGVDPCEKGETIFILPADRKFARGQEK